MAYSSIIQKHCKCRPDCRLYPDVSFQGYNKSHAPQDVVDKVLNKLKERQKKVTASRGAASKLRSGVANTDFSRDKSKEYNTLDSWFREVRKKLTGRCQCGCGKPSSKADDRYYKHSCSHVFPKSKFPTLATHPHNFVERAFWGGCHSVMDDTSMDRWTGFADWENIKEIFHELAPLLTDEERSTKFYTHFEKLIYGRN